MTRNVLSNVNRFKLWNLVKAEYPKLEMNDEQFAKHAAEKLKCEIGAWHVKAARQGLKIPSAPIRYGKPGSMENRLRVLESKVGQLGASLGIAWEEN